MNIRAATLTFVSLEEPLELPTELPELDDDERKFLLDHIADLRQDEQVLDKTRARFKSTSNVGGLLGALRTAEAGDFCRVAGQIVQAIKTEMSRVAKGIAQPSPGIVAVVSAEDGANWSVTVLKLLPDTEAAEFEKQAKAGVRLRVLTKLLPGPGGLQKGLSCPDSRDRSDGVFRDSQMSGGAVYFRDALGLTLSPTAAEAEKALFRSIVKEVPRSRWAEAIGAADGLEGEGVTVVGRLKESYPELAGDVPVLQGSDQHPAGLIRQGHMLGRKIRYYADNIELRIPVDRLDRIEIRRSNEQQKWITTITTDQEPTAGPV